MWVPDLLCKLQKGCTRLAAASDEVYQLLAHDQWFTPGTLASSTTKTGRHDIAEILLKVALNTINQIKIKSYLSTTVCVSFWPFRLVNCIGHYLLVISSDYRFGIYNLFLIQLCIQICIFLIFQNKKKIIVPVLNHLQGTNLSILYPLMDTTN